MNSNTRGLYLRAANFYSSAPTGQYDGEAAHALAVYHHMLEALEFVQADIKEGRTLQLMTIHLVNCAVAYAKGE